MVRSLLAIFAGYLLIAVGVVSLFALVSLETAATSGFMAIALACNLAFATAGGYVTALLAGQSPFVHGLGLMGLASGMWIVSATSSASSYESLGFQLLNWGMMALGVLTGAYWRSHQQRLSTDKR